MWMLFTLTLLNLTSAQASYDVAIKREVLEAKRVSRKVIGRLRQLSGHSNQTERQRDFEQAYFVYRKINSTIRKFHKHVLKKDRLGTDANGEYSEDQVIKDLSEYINEVANGLVAFAELDGYKKLPSSRRLMVSQIAVTIDTLVEYLREDDIIISLPKEFDSLASTYRRQEEFLENKQEILGDYFDAKDAFEEGIEQLREFVKKYIKRNHGPNKDDHRIYTSESYDYINYRRLARKLVKELEDFDVNSTKTFASISEKVSKMQHLVNFSRTNTKNAKVLLNHVNKLFNKFSLELSKVNSKIVHKPIQATLGVKEVEFDYYRATQVCSMLGGPGDILLRRAIETDIDLFEDFSPRTSGAIKLVEFLKFNDRQLDFRHAEVITEIERDTNISTVGFYPLSFNWGKDEEDKMPPFIEISKGYRKCHSDGCDTYSDYRTNFAWLSINEKTAKKVTRKKEKALSKVAKKEKYSKLGVCSDFVNWAFGNVISSNWNRIPILRNLIQIIYPPEGLQTPDNLYESYKTNVVCEVENRKLTYPEYVNAHTLKEQVLRDLNSKNVEISTHAKNTLNKLIKENIMDEELNLNYDVINFKTYK